MRDGGSILPPSMFFFFPFHFLLFFPFFFFFLFPPYPLPLPTLKIFLPLKTKLREYSNGVSASVDKYVEKTCSGGACWCGGTVASLQSMQTVGSAVLFFSEIF